MADHNDLKTSADRLREFGNDSQRVQATMQEETAVAIHRVAEAVEALVEDEDEDVPVVEELKQMQGRLAVLEEHEEISGYAAEDYVGTAITNISAAVADLQQATDE